MGVQPMIRFVRLWNCLRSSFWFVPSLMGGSSILLTVALIELDSTRRDEWFAALAERTVESSHDRSGIDVRLPGVREAFEEEPSSGRHGREDGVTWSTKQAL